MFKFKPLLCVAYISAAGFPCCCFNYSKTATTHHPVQTPLPSSPQSFNISQADSIKLSAASIQLLRQNNVPNGCKVLISMNARNQYEINAKYSLFLHGNDDLACQLDLDQSKIILNRQGRGPECGQLLFVWEGRHLLTKPSLNRSTVDLTLSSAQVKDVSNDLLVEIEDSQKLIDLAGIKTGENRYFIRLEHEENIGIQIGTPIPSYSSLLVFDNGSWYSFCILPIDQPDITCSNPFFFHLINQNQSCRLIVADDEGNVKGLIKVKFTRPDPQAHEFRYSWKLVSYIFTNFQEYSSASLLNEILTNSVNAPSGLATAI